MNSSSSAYVGLFFFYLSDLNLLLINTWGFQTAKYFKTNVFVFITIVFILMYRLLNTY